MDIVLRNLDPVDVHADLLVISAARLSDPILRALDLKTGSALRKSLRRRGFENTKDSAVLYQSAPGALRSEYLMIVRRSDDAKRTARLMADVGVARARELRARTIALLPPDPASSEELAETLELASYNFHGLKSAPARKSSVAERAFILGSTGKNARAAIDRGRALAGAANLARDLVNLPADIATPSYLASAARRLAKSQRLTVRVLNERQIRRLGMGALLGVARGSSQPPCFIEIVYRPRRFSARIALVGKGITFDSGGLSLKSHESMQTQKKDMAGAAVVLGVMSVARTLNLPVELRGYIPATENMPSGTAIKPGDVVRAWNGKTIEVLNTDAEGRLVLADALSYAARLKPDVILDFATLTAAVRTALGPRYAAIMAMDSSLARSLIASAAAAGENLWQLPLVEEYRRDLDSSVADLKNTGEGHSGTIIGGLFLREFTDGLPWAHIDFSSTAVTEKPFPGHPRGASGFGVRSTLRYLLTL